MTRRIDLFAAAVAASLIAAPVQAQRPASTDSAGSPLDIASWAGQPRVQHYLDYFTGQARPRVAKWLERSQPFQAQIGDRLSAAGLPSAFSFLPLIESGFASDAVSKKGAVGLWQFMPKTARQYGLRVDRLVDERRDPERATNAAVRHLGDLKTKFSSSFLAAAAYNAGAGRVERGLGQLGDPDSEDGDTGVEGQFFRLASKSLLAKETRDYVPQLIAAAMIGQNPEQYGFSPSVPAPYAPTAYDSVTVDRPTTLAQLARAIGVAPVVLRQLNPQFVIGVTPPGASSSIRIPPGLADIAAARIPTLPAALIPSFDDEDDVNPAGSKPAGPDAHTLVRRGETLEAVAGRTGVSVHKLRRANALPKRYRLRPGQILRVP
ncbi:MAG: transglycosylase SLT domain-containing protein, partial [Gemmatimonadota bacterium]